MFRRASTRTLTVASAVAVATIGPCAAAFAVTTNDAYVENLWGLDQINTEAGWTRTTGGGAVVAVVDSGVDLDHPDLQSNLLPGVTFSRCSAQELSTLTGCGNGDWLTPGKGDTVANAEADAWHGTHVAGTVAAIRDNGIGVAGVAPDAKILPVKVLDNTGTGVDAEIAAGIRWSVDHGADVINMSLGKIPGSENLDGNSSPLRLALDYAADNDVLVVIASGNLASPFCSSPAHFDGAVCVVATGLFEEQAWYSQGAIKDDMLAVSAPGGTNDPVFCDTNILSTVPLELTDASYCGESSVGYDTSAGTSMATPHVAGYAALLASLGCDRTQMVDILTTTSRQLDGTRGTWNPAYGYGIVDAALATEVAAEECNSAPLAGADSAEVVQGQEVLVDVLANDTDGEGDELTVTAVSTPLNGSARIVDGQVVFTAPSWFVGTDQFTYDVSDGRATSTGVVTVTVSEVPNSAPAASDDTAVTQRNTPVTVSVLGNDSDPDGDALHVVSVEGAGDVVVNVDGTITYTPAKNFTGSVAFTYTVTDGDLASTARLVVDVVRKL